jgi:predicted amidophosphoribosyltransferase
MSRQPRTRAVQRFHQDLKSEEPATLENAESRRCPKCRKQWYRVTICPKCRSPLEESNNEEGTA